MKKNSKHLRLVRPGEKKQKKKLPFYYAQGKLLSEAVLTLYREARAKGETDDPPDVYCYCTAVTFMASIAASTAYLHSIPVTVIQSLINSDLTEPLERMFRNLKRTEGK